MKGAIFQKKILFFTCFASGALILGIIVIADNKQMDLCFFRCYKIIFLFYHILPNSAYNTKIYNRDTNRK